MKFGVEAWTEGPLHAKFHPIGATYRPCRAKNLKIGLWVTLSYQVTLRYAMLPVTNTLTNRRHWKHPPRFATLRRWVKINSSSEVTIGGTDISELGTF